LKKGETDFYSIAKFKINTKKILTEFPKNITNFKIFTQLVPIEKDSISNKKN